MTPALLDVLAPRWQRPHPPHGPCRWGHRTWFKLKSSRSPKGWYWRCRTCDRASKCRAQRAYAKRRGEDYRREDRERSRDYRKRAGEARLRRERVRRKRRTILMQPLQGVLEPSDPAWLDVLWCRGAKP